MKPKLCFEINDMAFPIKLEQSGVNRFRVTYGKQVTRNLSYAAACAELGASIMHALACDGKIHNETEIL